MPTQPCVHHPRVAGVSHCVECGDALCRECIVPTRVGFKCARCTGVGSAPSRRRRLLGAPAAILILGVAAAAAASFGALRPGRERTAGAGDSRAGLSVIRRGTPANITFHAPHGVLNGTIDLPEDANGAGVVVVSGFGPTTRDGIAAADGAVEDPLYRDIGQALAGAGFTVLRYDKRTPQPATGAVVDFDVHVSDALAAVRFLERRDAIDGVAVVGHDEGGLIGLRASSGRDAVSALALLSTPGRPLVEVLAQEIRAGALATDGRRSRELARELQGAVGTLLARGNVPPVSAPLEAVLPAHSPEYLRDVFSLDPAREARFVGIPVLIVRGMSDPGIRDADVRALVEALRRAPQVEVVRTHGAGHTLLVGGGMDDGISGSGEHSRRDPRVLGRVATWLRARVASSAGS